MAEARLEHVNFTASDPQRTADALSRIFGWKIRWQGEAIHKGHTIHLGGAETYFAIYSQGAMEERQDSYRTLAGLNHIGVVVDDLDAVEKRVNAEGFKTHSHADYEPGRRFYFHDHDGIEFEVVMYD